MRYSTSGKVQLFRGHSMSSYKLQPTALREVNSPLPKFGKKMPLTESDQVKTGATRLAATLA